MRNRTAFILALYLYLPLAAMANVPISLPSQQFIPHADIVGNGTLSLAFWDIYDVQLVAPNGKWTSKAPYALEIHYFADIAGKEIAQRTIDEIKAQGFKNDAKLASWGSQLAQILPDVKDGDHLSSIATPNGETLFYKNNTRIGIIKDKTFTPQFFAIWLDEKTSEPALRRNLLGMR
ncbi:MAG: chalcone isomerase family protein [Alphaproteobacteria bacterium]|nr:chalcone isomerase family protein [Alphaproteobacteria bacterium]